MGELKKIGIEIAKSTVETYMVRKRGPASPTWKSFLRNQRDLVSADFFVVPTVRFGLLWVFVLIASERRRVVHFNVTDDPTSEWAARQLVEAFPYETAPRFLLRDRDGVYGKGKEFSRCVRALGIEELLTASRSPWQNGYVDRLIGTIRRDCLDHVIVWNERHLKRVLTDYFAYYHRWRTHLSLEMDTPERRLVQRIGRIVAIEELAGLHHHYEQRAA